jgi:acyl-CoA dehydrogenase
MLSLPFFDATHREVRGRVMGSAAEFETIASRGEAGSVDEAGRDSIRVCAALGLCRLIVPRAFGGDAPPGLDLRTVCVLREALASYSGLADAVFAVQGLGSYPLALSGHQEMSERFLPAVARGEAVAAFALTEPGAGSDVSAVETRATRDGDAYILEGAKTFISNAPIASFFVVFARTAEGPRRALSAFVVEANAPGLTISRVQHVMAPHPIAGLRLQACRVPATHRLGEEGDGMRIALGTLDFFRTSVGAAACGLAGRALAESRTRARSRKQFGVPIGDFQLIQASLAQMATDLDAARLLVYRAAWLKDQGQERLTRESAMAKLFATEAAQRIVDRAVQIHGGIGVERGSVVERLYREVRPPRIYEGTSEIQQIVIARDLLQGPGRD